MDHIRAVYHVADASIRRQWLVMSLPQHAVVRPVGVAAQGALLNLPCCHSKHNASVAATTAGCSVPSVGPVPYSSNYTGMTKLHAPVTMPRCSRVSQTESGLEHCLGSSSCKELAAATCSNSSCCC
jgi:hypothetical protein